jgi:hypothetical protein
MILRPPQGQEADVKRFTGSTGSRLTALSFLALTLVMSLQNIHGLIAGPHNAGAVLGRGLILSICGALIVTGIWLLLESFASYELTAETITRRAWNGTRQLCWSDIVACKITGSNDSSYRLADSRGVKLQVTLHLLSQERRSALAAEINPHLAAVRERQHAEAETGTRAYPLQTGFPLQLAACLVGSIALGLLPFAHPGGSPAALIYLAAGGIGAIVSLVALITAVTSRIVLTGRSVTLRHAMGFVEIPLSAIVAIKSRARQKGRDVVETTAVVASMHKIEFSSTMPDYDIVRDFVKRHAPPEALYRGAALAATEPGLPNMRMPVSSIVMVVVLTALGLFYIACGLVENSYDKLLDERGVTTTGKITRIEPGGQDEYEISYLFRAGHVMVVNSGSVQASAYRNARPGQTIRVTYDPKDPIRSRCQNSAHRSAAPRDFSIALLNWAVAGCTLVYYLGASRKRARQGPAL